MKSSKQINLVGNEYKNKGSDLKDKILTLNKGGTQKTTDKVGVHKKNNSVSVTKYTTSHI